MLCAGRFASISQKHVCSEHTLVLCGCSVAVQCAVWFVPVICVPYLKAVMQLRPQQSQTRHTGTLGRKLSTNQVITEGG